ncbi:hypothetical protein KZZ52_03435 [Dactylosporangium sp. AC04546]|uniref:hypothetical protein n=1 Tax=Dactylosporangium sp. AC04546 TaxID=2862460 RepID=UPI001EDDF564|nr:hypothetical protein [Dactylosporangium sp. AC04546]WVK84494.1 hypothetical protein KZZ52_03435 [Dactylosporangium sp. AC04546]
MTRPAKLALFITGAVVLCVVAACGVALALRDWVPGLAGCADATAPTKTAVSTQKVRIEQLWPRLVPIQSVHWQEREARARSCPEIGPMDYVMNGFAVVTRERADELAQGGSSAAPSPGPSTVAPPQHVPEDLLPFAPKDPTWLDVGDHLLLDQRSATVYFTRSTS